MLEVLMNRSLQSLVLRIQYWINKMMKLMHNQKQKLSDENEKHFTLPAAH